MAEFLLELFSEEIPARMQARAAEDLKCLVTEGLGAAGLTFALAEAYVTPRRLTVVVEGLPLTQPDVVEERKGPRVDAPQAAIDGFLKSAGVTLDQCEQRDTPKGMVWFALTTIPGGPTLRLLPAVIRKAILGLPWPKSMRAAEQVVRWVRPLHSVLAILDGETVPFACDLHRPDLEADGSPESRILRAGNTTRGHRFLAPEPFEVSSFADYRDKLRAAKVVLDREERKAIIRADAERMAAAEGLALRDDPGLLEEVAGLVEWPVVHLGRIDDAFMDVPPEVLTTSMRTHQRYFALWLPGGVFPGLAPRFAVVANTETTARGATVIAGNERVLRARLSDAKFFWDQDRKTPLGARVRDLGRITFHAKLGSMLDKALRMQDLAGILSDRSSVGEPELCRRAAWLAKADLTTDMVGEFPELQGVMGAHYARAQGEVSDVIRAIEHHYKPLGPSDICPTHPVIVMVALADKIDTLVGFFAIGETPTGSRDPYALRRAAIGIVRLIVENELTLSLSAVVSDAVSTYVAYEDDNLQAIIKHPIMQRQIEMDPEDTTFDYEGETTTEFGELISRASIFVRAFPELMDLVGSLKQGGRAPRDLVWEAYRILRDIDDARQFYLTSSNRGRQRAYYGEHAEIEKARVKANSILSRICEPILRDLIPFFTDRLKVVMREQGVRHDLIDAVFAVGGEDDLRRLLARVEALGAFLASEDGANLLIAYRRAGNIVRIEAKKDRVEAFGTVDPTALVEPEERALAAALDAVAVEIAPLLEREDFAGAMAALARLRPPVDAFFDRVTVNTDDRALRRNRLALLSAISATMDRIADFSKVEG